MYPLLSPLSVPSNAYDFGYDTSTSAGWTNVTWQIQQSPCPNTVWRSIFFTAPTNGFVVGNENKIMKYTQMLGMERNKLTSDARIFPNPAYNTINVYIEFGDLQIKIFLYIVTMTTVQGQFQPAPPLHILFIFYLQKIRFPPN